MDDNEVRINLGRNLTNLLKERRYSQRRLAREMGKSPSIVNHYTSGGVFPSVSALIEICDILGTTPNRLLGYCPLKGAKYKRGK